MLNLLSQIKKYMYQLLDYLPFSRSGDIFIIFPIFIYPYMKVIIFFWQMICSELKNNVILININF